MPIVIHLWSKHTRTSVDFGSIRFLSETETKTMRSVMPSQLFLLLIRLVLLSLLVLIIAETAWPFKAQGQRIVYLVDVQYEGEEWLKNWEDTIDTKNQMRWLANGFPAISLPAPKKNTDYWKLLSQDLSSYGDSFTVLSSLSQKNFRGKHQPFKHKFNWLSLPFNIREETVLRYQKDENSFEVNARYDEWETTFAVVQGSKGGLHSIPYFLEASDDFLNYESTFIAAIETVQEFSPYNFLRVSESDSADWIFWLKTTPEPTNDGFQFRIDGASMTYWTSTAHSVRLSPNWNLTTAVEINLPEKLLHLANKEFIDISDQELRVVDPKGFTYKSGNQPTAAMLGDIADYLWIGFLVVLGFERWLSFKSSTK